MAIASITSALAQALTRLLTTLRQRAQDYGEETDNDTIAVIIEHWVHSVLKPDELQAVLISAQDEFGQYAIANQRWLDVFAQVIQSSGTDANALCENLWRAHLFHLESAAEALWNQYPEIQRRLPLEIQQTLPRTWGDWIFPLQSFMGKIETRLLDLNPVWDDLLSSEIVLILLEEQIPAQAASGQFSSPYTTERQFVVAAALDAYLRACDAQIAHIDPRGYPRSVNRTVPLADVYIPLRLRLHSGAQSRSAYMRYRTASYSHTELLTFADGVAVNDSSVSPSLSFQEVLDRHSQVVILGGSGAGKSTLLRALVAERVHVLRDQELGSIQIEGRPDGSTVTQLARRLPIYIDLADFVDEPGDGDLYDFAIQSAIDLAEDSAMASVLVDLIQTGQCLFLLDGFDQVTTDEQRRMLAASTAQASARWRAAGNSIVVTSRHEAYAAAPLPGNFPVYAIRGLERGQIGSFLLRWSLTLARMRRPLMTDEEAIRRAESETLSLVREVATNQRLYALANTPLILRMLVGVYRPGMLLIPQRAAIYELVADALIREWHLPHSAVDRPAVLEQDVTHLLGELAFWLQASRPAGLLSEQELREILRHIWTGMYPETPEAQVNQVIDSFLGSIRTNVGVLAELSPQRYGFIYHGLQEYFAARYLVSSFRLAPSRIRTYLHDPRWDEVIRLAVAFTGLRSREDASELIKAAILARGPRAEQDHCTPSPFENLLKRDLFFAARLLGSGVETAPDLTHEIATSLMSLWLDGDRDSLGRFTLLFDRAYHHLALLDGTLASRQAMQIARDRLSSPDEHIQAYAAEALTLWPSHFAEGCEALTEHGREGSLLMRRAVAGALGRIGALTLPGYRLLLHLLSDGDEEVSALAHQALQAAAPVPLEALSMWIDFLRSGNQTRRRISLRVLAHMGSLPPVVINELLHLLGDPDAEMRQAAVDVLAGVTVLNESALMAICRAAQDMRASTEIRISAINALRRPVELPHEVIELLVDWSYDPDVAVRRAAILALGTCRNSSEEVLDALVERLEDPVDSVRATVIEPLVMKGRENPRVLHVLAHKVDDPIHTVRCALATSLRHFPNPVDDLRRALLTLLSDGEMIVRETSLETIATLETPGPEIIQYLIDVVLMDQDYGIRAQAVRTLARLRHLPAPALNALAHTLLNHWQTCGAEIAACLRAHQPLYQDVIQEVMDLAVMTRVGASSTQRPPSGLRALALEILGSALEEAPTAVRILVNAAVDGEDTTVRIAALRGLAQARTLMSGIENELMRLLGQGPLEVRCAAAITLGTLVRNLPNPPFHGEQLVALAKAQAGLLREVAPRASWESNTQTQNDLLLALEWVVTRARPSTPRLPAQSEDLSR